MGDYKQSPGDRRLQRGTLRGRPGAVKSDVSRQKRPPPPALYDLLRNEVNKPIFSTPTLLWTCPRTGQQHHETQESPLAICLLSSPGMPFQRVSRSLTCPLRPRSRTSSPVASPSSTMRAKASDPRRSSSGSCGLIPPRIQGQEDRSCCRPQAHSRLLARNNMSSPTSRT